MSLSKAEINSLSVVDEATRPSDLDIGVGVTLSAASIFAMNRFFSG